MAQSAVRQQQQTAFGRPRSARNGMPPSRSGERLHMAGSEPSSSSSLPARQKTSRVPASRAAAEGKNVVSSAASRRALGDVSNFDKKYPSSHISTETEYIKPGVHIRGMSTATHEDEVQKHKISAVNAASGALRREIKSRGSASSMDSTASSQHATRNNHLGVKRVRSSMLNGNRATAPLPRSISNNSRLGSESAVTTFSDGAAFAPATAASMEVDAHNAGLTDYNRLTSGMEDRVGKRPASADPAEDANMATLSGNGTRGRGNDDVEAGDDDEEDDDDDDYSSSEAEDEDHGVGPSHEQPLEDAYVHDVVGGASADEDDEQDPLHFNPDPECLVTLPPEFQEEALYRVSLVSARYEQDVILPQLAKAALDRRAAVRSGELPPEVAAHDDELAQMGLDPEDVRDTSMVAEYAKEIFSYMSVCEMETMANPNYMAFQNEIQWHMRATLVDWLLQVHMRYHLLPETLFIAINIIDRFLSVRVVSLAKLQLVGVIAMFIAAKYEEIVAPSVDEFVAMTEGGHSKDEIFKGERIILSTLDFKISSYCSPYSWVRKISKADDYDIQVRTLAKFLMEVTLLDHRFLRAKPSLIAAISMYLSKKMLGGQWDEGFVYYSNFCEEQLIPGANLLLEKLVDPAFGDQFVCRKYAGRKFLKASLFARDWAKRNTFGAPSPEATAVPNAEPAYAFHGSAGVFAAA
ncbi:unnamed protein product [Parajaminaea phylloscopi]